MTLALGLDLGTTAVKAVALPVTYAPGGDLGSAHGVARGAGVAAGLWGWDDRLRSAEGAVTHEPAALSMAQHRELYGVYRDLYTRLAPAFAG